ncbi:MAG: PBP1A family penicillin-binding protein [Gemmatimonadetes bacterium]|nr:PBP1A family penicillin-binding protein [Gemmatimonadota bacterium]
MAAGGFNLGAPLRNRAGVWQKRVGKWVSAGGRVLRHRWVWTALVLGATATAGFLLGAWQNLCADCPSIAQIHTWEPQQTSKVLSNDGRLVAEIGIERRTAVPIASLPPYVAQAFVAIEDRRFYEHGGFDPRAFARAVVSRLIPRSLIRAVTGISLRTGGASTITQQLARNMFVEAIGFDVSPTRKAKEIQVALELERAYTKEQILEAYMNQINLGPGWWGIQTASRNYFGKDAVDMNPAEAATLAAVANRPGLYSPLRNPENALSRRNMVLDRMATERYLSEEEAAEWKVFPLPTERAMVSEGSAPYFVELVRQVLEPRFGNLLYTGGLIIYTTLDVEMQRAAEQAMDRGWESIEARLGKTYPRYADFVDQTVPFEEANSPYVQGAFIAMDPQTGAIRALIGGRDFDQSKFNRATQAHRQAGSSFKPFVYVSALAQRIPPSRVIADRPFEYTEVTGDVWSPENFSGDFQGEMTLRRAFRESINTVSVWLGNEIGWETVAQTAQSFGIRTPIARVPSIAVGSPDVIPIQMTEAYSVFATLGIRVEPNPILRVTNADGGVLWEPEPIRSQVLDRATARLMVTLMEDVVNAGTGSAIRSVAGLPYEVPAAGKTGTTNESTNLWFIGFTPNLEATVWFGFDELKTLYEGATSGEATRVWGSFMREVYFGDAFPDESADGAVGARRLLEIPERWPLDGLDRVEVDNRTGLLASQWCPEDRRYWEYFIPGTEPTEACDEGIPGQPGRRFRLPGR